MVRSPRAVGQVDEPSCPKCGVSAHASSLGHVGVKVAVSAAMFRSRATTLTLLALAATFLFSCTTSTWTAGTTIRADARRVAVALGDPPPRTSLSLADIPELQPPHHPRTCCAFGMDLTVELGEVEIPFFEVSNVVGPSDLTGHDYDLATAAPETEVNGLVYTCRGGWIDTSHVRENADNVLYLALSIAPHLATGTTFEIPGHGAPQTVVVRPIPQRLIDREGALNIASELAGWIAYRVGIWHEVMSWYGYQMVAGFSEEPSTFSPEDLYSNLLGIRLAMAAIDEHDFGSAEEYDQAIAAYIFEGLTRLEAQPTTTARAVMTGLDGSWWDSSQRLPNNLLVRRRRFPSSGNVLAPWRAEDAQGNAPAIATLTTILAAPCGETRARSLVIPGELGAISASELVSLSWVPEGWADATFPFREGSRRVDESELDGLVAQLHTAIEAVLGSGFDQP